MIDLRHTDKIKITDKKTILNINMVFCLLYLT